MDILSFSLKKTEANKNLNYHNYSAIESAAVTKIVGHAAI